ncbi:autotransporter strand-loop-strand O-heptosyltransferase [Acetobacteraceae bacterium KSS8]|uniref:Autotransporter strand-loop-strand O-heptosyltransferase n=1 Tax=Endosaccharibacter trunci TaxID=2812733 RepID=A0ABT1W990_9PROT|nr:autotransporter strand-loop-strand O-heptosyltransferase [Acetobacteraceae bacterium KSS8]
MNATTKKSDLAADLQILPQATQDPAVAGTPAPASGQTAAEAAARDSGSQASRSPAQATPKPAFPPPSAQPTQSGPLGIRFDFNAGARVLLPPGRRWRVRLRDLDTGNVLFFNENDGALVMSTKRYFVRIGLDVWDLSAPDHDRPVLSHEYDCTGRTVLINFPIGTLGDTIGWFPYAARFAAERGAHVVCALSKLIIPLLRDTYPHITFVSHEEVVERALAEQAYATYSLGLFFDDKDGMHQPTDFRLVGLHRTAGYILGVDPREEAPQIGCDPGGRPIEEPYVCIAVQSSSQCKYWNNPNGWREVIAHLKARGYRVVCIDQKPMHGTGIVWNHIPHGVEDQTGDRPLTERARWLKHAAFFVGLSSGLSWLAWAAGCPVVLISGFTHPTNEFDTPFRVINWHSCNACWNDPRERFDHHDFLWCPRHANTPRQFECTRLITTQQVMSAIDRIPAPIPAASR